jgi:regulatory protein
MERRGFSPGTIEEVVLKLKESRYLDDTRYALNWAEAAVRNGRGFGFKLRLELLRRGVPEQIAAEVTAEVAGRHDESETLREILARKFPGFTPNETDDRRKRRIVGYFQRRGFTLSAIMRLFTEKG